MEHQRTLAVLRRGVPTLEPLAFGECGTTVQASYLITRTLPDVCPLNVFLEQTLPDLPGRRQTQLRQRLTSELGRFIARMHQAGITHQDLHPGNLLLRWDQDHFPHLYLIDLHAVRLGKPLSWSASRANLVLLNRWFILRASRADRRRFLEAYRQSRRELLLPAHAERDLEKRTVASNLEFWQHHDSRCLASNRYFRPVRSAVVWGHAVADLDPVLLSTLLADPDEPFRQAERQPARAVILKNSQTSSVIELTVQGSQGPLTLIYKRFNRAHWTSPLANMVRRSPALRSYRMGHALRWRGLPTPRPLLVLHRRWLGMPAEGYLLTEKLPAARHLHEYLQDLEQVPVAIRRERLRQTIDRLARLIAALHQRRLVHEDLKAANILVSSEPWRVTHPDRKEPGPTTPASSEQLWLIDLVGVAVLGKLARRRKIRNLARLNASFHGQSKRPGGLDAVTRTDKLRFLRVYLGWGLRGKAGWKDWWRAIERATLAKVRRNQRRGRPLF
jgi:tRNA A-37 threonylcarbamoyl transferase component Bud32